MAPTPPAPVNQAGIEVFLTPEARAINEARLSHLASLGLHVARKSVLEVGGGIGLHTCFFESLGCDVLFTDARAENLEEARRRYPHRKTAQLDLDKATDLTELGMFDVIYCYGTLYHLSKPARALKLLAEICREMILIETCVTPGNAETLNLEEEPAWNPNQAVSGRGCRPTRAWVMAQLREHFGHAYTTVSQPDHPDFETNWFNPKPRKLYRAVFVGSKGPLTYPALRDTLVGGTEIVIKSGQTTPLRWNAIVKTVRAWQAEPIIPTPLRTLWDARLSVPRKIKHGRQITVRVPLAASGRQQDPAPRERVIQSLVSQGFVLISEQTEDAHELLTFFRLGRHMNEVDQFIRALSDRSVLLMARALRKLRPLRTYPGWFFSIAENGHELSVRLRHSIWNTCRERGLEKPMVCPWHGPSKLNLYLGNDVSRAVYIGGCIEPNEFAFIGSVLRRGMVMIDVGANDGLFTVFAARRVGRKGRVLAFEPSAREFARLQANLKLNRFRNVKAIAKAVANVNSVAPLKIAEYGHEGQNTLGDFVHAVKQAGMEMIETCRLDECLASEKLTRLDLIKIDVEGAEYKVLQGAEETLRRFRPVILLELLDKALQHQGNSTAQVLEFLRSLDYRIYDFSSDSGRLVPGDFKTHSDNIVASPRVLAEG